MMSFAIVTASLLCRLSWISVSGSESQTVEVQPGEDVTLLCSNFSTTPSQIYWFRAVKRSPPRCVSFMFEAPEPAILCDGFQNGKFEMRSNMSAVFLKITQVNSSDSGLYFCGYIITKNLVIVDATYLEVQEEPGEIVNLMSVILGAVTVVLTKVIIGLVVTITRFQTEPGL
ncbi:T-cell surface glycoprotein CD8 beta chain-like isoform X2 [Sander vitreus]